MQVWVTRDDIDRGVPGSSRQCAVALAVRRAVPEFTCVVVSGRYVTIDIGRGRSFFAELTDEQKKFIVDFDNQRAVDPIMIEIPDERFPAIAAMLG